MTEQSILANTNAHVKVTHCYPETESGCTGFSNVRWAINRGIYLDCDMIVLGDIAELWSYREPGKRVCLADGSTEVMVIDGTQTVNKIPLCWNVEDTTQPNMKLLHFTDLKTQPWFYSHPDANAVAIYEHYKQRINNNKTSR